MKTNKMFELKGKMQFHNSSKSCFMLFLVTWLCPSMSMGALTVLFYNDFDDGNFDGWAPEEYDRCRTACGGYGREVKWESGLNKIGDNYGVQVLGNIRIRLML